MNELAETEALAATPADVLAAYRAEAIALRNVGRLSEADAILANAAERFPEDAGVFIEWAWMAHHRSEVDQALERWKEVRRLLPAHHGFTGAAITLREAGRFDEAETVLREAMAAFPETAEPLVEHAWLAYHRRDWPEAIARWDSVRERFPDKPIGYTGGAAALREAGGLGEAENLLRAAEIRFPYEATTILIERARVAEHRKDWTEAAHSWEAVRTRDPGNAIGYTGGAAALREAGRLAEAEQLLSAGRSRFPNDNGLMVEHAAIAMRQRNWTLAAERWELVRNHMPNSAAGYIGGAAALSEQRQFTDAQSLLEQAIARMPNDPAPIIDHAWASNTVRDWPEAARRWERVRRQFPGQIVGYTAGATALRELGRFDEAEEILNEATRRFPHEPLPMIDLAWLATARHDLPGAAARWADVRLRFPDARDGYLRGALALASLWQYEDADALLADAIIRFPDDSEIVCEAAWLAYNRKLTDEAERRFSAIRTRFPDEMTGYLGGALLLRDRFLLREAETMLESACRRLPRDSRLALEYAKLPMFPPLKRDRNPDEAFCRLDQVRRSFPDYEEGYLTTIRYARQEGRVAEAEAVAAAGLERLPQSSALATEYGAIAAEHGDFTEAGERFSVARQRFPHEAGPLIGLAAALCAKGCHDEADQMLHDAIERFPTTSAVFIEYGSIAARRGRWREALERWVKGQRRFADVRDFGHRIFEAQLHLTETDEHVGTVNSEDSVAPVSHPREAMRALVTQFESLGGNGFGCEFGLFQREFGAEPLGLLRWADMPFDGLVFALEKRFHGIGTPEETELLVNSENPGRPEYCTFDRRGFMRMHTFVLESDLPRDKMWLQVLRRLVFLKDKLIADLESGEKTFVYRLTDRNLEDAEIKRLHNAMRAYGENNLLYVRYEDSEHPNGTVEVAAPGLLIGYIDRFIMDPDGNESASPPSESWTTICRNALAILHPAAAAASASQIPPEPRNVSPRDFLMEFESLGGRGLGCEFGMFQREFGAEPLGLLRWADMPFDGTIFALENRFEGVGTPENTELFVNRENARPEWCTVDKRGFMFMRTFVYEDEVARDIMWQKVLRRLSFLKDKLTADLESGEKMFVYRLTDRNLDDREIKRLHNAVRAYGDNTLLYVRYADALHANGTVEVAAPGLLIGYMDRFKMAPDGAISASPPSASWMTVCQNAHALWRTQNVAARDLLMEFESLGGGGHGCEFGILQRHFGAEPLGLLRWADIFQDELSAALEVGFAGVGEPEFTEIFVPAGDGPPEYWTQDKRYGMVMRSFVRVDEMSLDRMTQHVTKRLVFLRDKLLRDLKSAEKIFVYKNMKRNLTDEELDRVYSDCRRYGENKLFYIRYADQNHSSGTVECVKPGLAIGYIDHFSHTPDTDEPLGASTDTMLALCRRAYALLNGSERTLQYT